MVDCTKLVRAMFEIADRSVLDVELHPVTITPRFTRDRLNLAIEFDLAHALQRLAQNGTLFFHLNSIIRMLVMAASAPLKIGARRSDTSRRGLRDFQQPAAPQIILDSIYFRAHLFTRQNIWREDNFALEAGQAVAAVNELFYREIFFGGQARSSPYGNMGVKHMGVKLQ